MTAANDTKQVTLSVPSMHCQHCVKTISRELKGLSEVVSVVGNLERKEVVVEYAGDALAKVKATLVEIGYPPAS